MPQYKDILQAIYDQLCEDLRSATSIADLTISPGFPEQEITEQNSATISLMEMATDFGNRDASAVEMGSGIEWGIEVRLAPPEDPADQPLWEKINVLDAFTALIETSGGLYAGYGMWPRVSRAILNLDDQLDEHQMLFQMQVSMVLTKRYGT